MGRAGRLFDADGALWRIGIGIAGIGALLLCFMLVYLLQSVFPEQLPLWACFGIVGAAVAFAGSAIIAVGMKRAGSVHLVPNERLTH